MRLRSATTANLSGWLTKIFNTVTCKFNPHLARSRPVCQGFSAGLPQLVRCRSPDLCGFEDLADQTGCRRGSTIPETELSAAAKRRSRAPGHYNARLSTSWRDVISHTPRAISC